VIKRLTVKFYPTLLGLFVLLLLASCASPTEAPPAAPSLTGPYLGQPLPGSEAQIFAPELISTGLSTRDVAMTPDGSEFYFGVSMGNFHYATIAFTKRVGGVWSPPEVVDFCRDARYVNAEPHITPDGKRLLFLSTRPIPGQDEKGNQDIWAVDRVDDGWGEPYNLGAPINTKGGEFFPSVTNDGTLYFTRSPEGTRENYIFRSRRVDGVYQEPEKLPAPLNTSPLHFNAFVAPDESYLIVPTTREDTLGGIDYYIFFRGDDGKFGEAINMGPTVNSAAGPEWSPYVSRDGKYFFFMARARDGKPAEPALLDWKTLLELQRSSKNGDSNIYWVDASFIEKLRPHVED